MGAFINSLTKSASMEPQQFSCGNLSFHLSGPGGILCFNGATTIQLWKLGSNGHWRRPEMMRFNGATTIQLWKPITRTVKPGGSSGFNGATTIQLWKPASIYSVSPGFITASMEPQQFSCGNQVRMGNVIVRQYELQWSHNNSVVETCLNFL